MRAARASDPRLGELSGLLLVGLVVLALLGAGCVAAPQARTMTELPRQAPVIDPAAPDGVQLYAPCTAAQAEELAATAQSSEATQPMLRAAVCLASAAEASADVKERIRLAEQGRELALKAAERQPDSGLAPYLAAYLAGIQAEADPLQGLDLARVIEHNAKRAAELRPQLDDAGPERMLALLYTRVPEPPVGFGDLDQGLDYARQAVKLAPASAENRLTLAEALLELDEPGPACAELRSGLDELPPGERADLVRWAAKLLGQLCDAI